MPDPTPGPHQRLTLFHTTLAPGAKDPRVVLPFNPAHAPRPPELSDFRFSGSPHAASHGIDLLLPEKRLAYDQQFLAVLQQLTPGATPARIPRVRSSGEIELVPPAIAERFDQQAQLRAAQRSDIRAAAQLHPEAELLKRTMQGSRLLTMPWTVDFAERVAGRLTMPLSPMQQVGFASREARYDLPDIRGYHVTLISGMWDAPDQQFADTCRVIDALKRGGAASITVMFTHLSARQDRTDTGRTHIDTVIRARHLDELGANHVFAIEPHNRYLETPFHSAVFHPMRASTMLLPALSGLLPTNPAARNAVVRCSPDFGGVNTATFYAGGAMQDLLIVYKLRDKNTGRVVTTFLNTVKPGCGVAIIDDLIDTAGTILEVAREAKRRGALRVAVFAAHGLYSRQAWDKLEQEPAVDLVVTGNTTDLNVPLWKGGTNGSAHKIAMVDFSPIVAETMLRQAISLDPSHPARQEGVGSVRSLSHEVTTEPVEWVGHEKPVIDDAWWAKREG